MNYTNSHEWILCDGEIGTVGISSHAQEELGEVVYVQLPKIGQSVEKEEEVAVLESTKAASDIYSPVSGIIIAINERVKEDPRILNESPEKDGWLFKIALSDLSELDTLLKSLQYLELVEGKTD